MDFVVTRRCFGMQGFLPEGFCPLNRIKLITKLHTRN